MIEYLIVADVDRNEIEFHERLPPDLREIVLGQVHRLQVLESLERAEVQRRESVPREVERPDSADGREGGSVDLPDPIIGEV